LASTSTNTTVVPTVDELEERRSNLQMEHSSGSLKGSL
jgi:hypothetical protein